MGIGIFALTIFFIMGAITTGYLGAFCANVPLRPGDYFTQVAHALSWMDFVLLCLKSTLFGIAIAVITCYHGLAQPLRLEEVSSVTVAAVAQSVIACVTIDALFIIIFVAL
jgi:ABC-type transporter Mla maintaining outer membrane lipid asymmetry permease subunit MlaE